MEKKQEKTEDSNQEDSILFKFNTTFSEFTNDILETFPEYSEKIKNNYNFDNFDKKTNKTHLNYFMMYSKKYIKEISEKKESIFETEEKLYLLEGIDFSELWKKIKENKNKQTIWKYLHTLYILGNALNSNVESLSDLMKNTGAKEENNDNMKELSEHANIMLNMFNSLSQDNINLNDDNFQNINNDIDNTSIGKIAQELANEINLDDFGLNLNNNSSDPSQLFANLFSGNNNKLMDLISNVGNKIQDKLQSGDIDEETLMKEAQSMMKNNPLFGNNPLFNNPDLMNQMNSQQENTKMMLDNNKIRKERLRDKLKKKLNLRKKKNKK